MRKFIPFLLAFFLACPVSWGGIDLAGDADSLTVPTSASIVATTGTFSVSFWANFDTFGAGVLRTLAQRGTDASTWGYQILLDDDRVRFLVVVSPSTVRDFTNTTDLSLNTWYHIACVWTNTSLDIYINGTKQSSSVGGGTLRNGGSDTFTIGVINGGASRYVDGSITEYALWNTNISDASVALLASSRVKRMPLQVSPSALKMYLPLDDYDGGSAIGGDVYSDQSGNANTPTATDADSDSFNMSEEVLSYP